MDIILNNALIKIHVKAVTIKLIIWMENIKKNI